MAHQIATSLCWNQPFGWWSYPASSPEPVALFVASLDLNGNLKMYQQLPGGNWSAFAPPQSPVALQSVLGLQNYIIALGTDNFLYISEFAQGNWSVFLQVPLPILSSSTLTVPIHNFSAIELIDSIMIVSNAYGNDVDGLLNLGLYSCCLTLSGGNAGNLSSAVNEAEWYVLIESQHLDPQLNVGTLLPSISDLYQSWNPTIALAAINPNSVVVDSWYNKNGGYSGPSPFSANPNPVYYFLGQNMPTDILLTTGANSTIQAIMLQSGQPWLFSSTDGVNWTTFGNLLPNNVVNPPSFDKLASGFDNAGNLQVVALGNDGSGELPYLFWQNNTDSSWNLFQFDSQGGPFGALNNPFTDLGNIEPTDLAIGLGWWYGPGNALQVAYLGSDLNVYLSWQDTEGNWNSYSGLHGNGLP
jgi:hypothetical protein